jgi:hypothetical protein
MCLLQYQEKMFHGYFCFAVSTVIETVQHDMLKEWLKPQPETDMQSLILKQE